MSEEVIAAARYAARRRKADHVLFEVRDVSGRSYYADREFDIAVASMAVHKFDAGPAVKILVETKRISRKVIIAPVHKNMAFYFLSCLLRRILMAHK
ncbi:MAG: hypothetical protein JXB19_04635 [Bacteroidales bacterium]|nr:hypothetical protein [Bacteroidales bacterium]